MAKLKETLSVTADNTLQSISTASHVVNHALVVMDSWLLELYNEDASANLSKVNTHLDMLNGKSKSK